MTETDMNYIPCEDFDDSAYNGHYADQTGHRARGDFKHQLHAVEKASGEFPSRGNIIQFRQGDTPFMIYENLLGQSRLVRIFEADRENPLGHESRNHREIREPFE